MHRTLVIVAMLALGPMAARGQWVARPGHGWVQVAVVHHDTKTRFDAGGAVVPLFAAAGRSITTSVFVTMALGVVPGIDVWAQVPYHDLRFNDVFEARTRRGMGDPRLHVRVGAEVFGVRWPVAVRAGVKWPVGTYTRDAEIIPLTEGQRDAEVMLEVGHSFWPAPVYVAGWLGYRWRAANTAAGRKPGNEGFFWASAGGQVGRVAWKMAVEGLSGATPELLGLPVASARRRLVQWLPSVGYRLGPGRAEVGARVPLAGRNLPAGAALLVGYFLPI